MSIRSRHRLIHDLIVAASIMSIVLGGWMYYDRYWTRHVNIDVAIGNRDVRDIARFVRNDRSLLTRDFNDGETLAVYVSYDCPEALSTLVELGLDPDRLGNYANNYAGGLTPLTHYAIYANDYRLLHTIIDHGGRLKVYDQAGLTPLHYAAIQGDTHAIEILIESGAEIDVRTKHNAEYLLQVTEGEDMTPLHIAAYWGELGAMEALLDHGADADARFIFSDEPKTIDQYLAVESPFNPEIQAKILAMLKTHRAKQPD